MKKLLLALAFFSGAVHSANYSTDEFLVGHPAPTVIIAHGCDGVNRFNVDWARQIRSWGYNAVIVDSFSKRSSSGVCMRGWEIHPVDRAKDILEAIEEIKTKPWHSGKFAAIGFSHGGSTMLELSKHDTLSALVSYYPSCTLSYPTAQPKTKVMMHLGAKDPWTPHWQCGVQNLTDPKYTVKVYENAGHAFDIDAPSRTIGRYLLWYDREADVTSREMTKALFDKELR